MSGLSKLKIVALQPRKSVSAEQQRRNKLAEKLTEQLKLVEAALGGEEYQRTRWYWHTDEDGNRKRLTRPVKLRQWWVLDGDGKVQFGLRYGATPIELQRGKTAVQVDKLSDLPAVIKTLVQAVADGELDEAIGLAVTARISKLKRKAA
jgi:hypothetical protein